MKIRLSDDFKRDYKKLSRELQRVTDKKLKLLEFNLSHPSLRVRKMSGSQYVYEGSVNMRYRFLFQICEGVCILLNIGKHEIVKK